MIKTLLLPVIKKYRKLLISIMIVSALGCTLMTGLSSSHESLKKTLYDYVDKYNYPSGVIRSDNVSRDVIDKVDKNVTVVPRLTFDTIVIHDKNYLTARIISYGKKDFYNFYTWESIVKEGVYLEYNFAHDNNISIGDKLKFKIDDEFREYEVVKIVSTPETLSIESSSNFSGFNSDFGYVYVPDEFIKKEFKKEYDKKKANIDEKDKELEDKKQAAEQEYNDLKNELDYYEDLINSESNRLYSLKQLLDNANISLNELLYEKDSIIREKEVLINKRDKLVQVKTGLDTINSSYEELIRVQEQLNSLQEFINVISELPEDTKIDTFIQDIIELDELSKRLEEQGIQIDLKGTIWEVSTKIKDICNEIIEDYEYLNSDSTKEYINNLSPPEETEEYYKLFNTIKKYYPELSNDNFIDGVEIIYYRLDILKEIIDNYDIQNLVTIITELDENEFKELVQIISNNKDLIKDCTTIGEVINIYNSLVEEVDETIELLNATKQEIITELNNYGMGEEELDTYITTINNGIVGIDNVLVQIDYYINEINNGLGQYTSAYNEAVYTLNSSKDTVNNNKTKLEEEYQSALTAYNNTKEEIKNAYETIKTRFNLDNYSNEFLLRFNTNNPNKELHKVEKELGIDIKNSYIYENSNVKKKIDVNLQPIETMSTFIPLVFFIVIMIVIFLFMSLLIKQCRREIGILRALGFSKFKVRLLFCSIMFVLSILSILIGTILSIGIIIYISTVYIDFFPLPYFKYVLDYKMYLISVITTIIVCQVSTLISTISIDSIKPAEAMSRELPEKSNTSHIVNKLKISPFSKFSIISLLRNKVKFIFSVICISACVMMIFTSFSFIKSKNFILEELYNKRINYDAQIFFSKEVDKKLLEEIKKLKYTSDVQKLYYYNGTITGNNKSRNTTVNGLDKDTKLINIYDENNKKKISIPNNGIILEKHIAKDLNVNKGDYIKIGNKKLKVVDISNQSINRINYISDNEIDEIETTDIYSIILNVKNNKYEDLVKYLSNKDNYLYTVYTSRSYDNILKTFKTYDLAAWIIIVFAIIIGFVIVWNTSLTNLLEQRKKLSLIKALGYQNSEISRNWYIQSIIQLIISLVIGFPLGIYISKIGFKKLSTIDREYIFVNDIKTYLLTILLVFIYVTISHIIIMKIFKNWNISEEIKDRE